MPIILEEEHSNVQEVAPRRHMPTISSRPPPPTYTGLWHSIRRNVKESIEFFFCLDDSERCVKGSRRKLVVQYFAQQERPSFPDVWPMKLGTNVKQCEILALKVAGFQLP